MKNIYNVKNQKSFKVGFIFYGNQFDEKEIYEEQ
jgi:hypothetical protein